MYHIRHYGKGACENIELNEIFLFKNVNHDVLKNIKYVKNNYNYGEVIYEYDNYSRALGCVMNGIVIIEQNGVTLKHAYEGDVFGVASLFNDSKEYVSIIRAKTKCVILFINQEVIRELIMENHIIAFNYITFLSDRIRYLNNKIASFTAGTVEERFAKYLIDLYEETESDKLSGLVYSRLASSLDVGRASLYRVIDNFIAQDMIIKDGRQIVIKDIEKIKKIIHKE